MFKNNSLKITGVTFFVIALLCLNISIQANISNDLDVKKNQINDEGLYSSSVSQVSDNGFKLILQEDFDAGKIPPVDPVLGQWVHDITAINETWYIDDSNPDSEPYCATVHRGHFTGLQDEWLITPRLDFSSCDVISLKFRWYTSQLTAVWKDVIDFNVKISVDQGWTWTDLWNEDDIEFVSWTWQDSGEIDLSAFAKEPDVRIGFQYYSKDITDAYAQEFSIDNIEVNGDSEQFSCNAGGPYEIVWSWNLKYGVQFHGSIEGGQPPFLNWTWDFGDGNTSKQFFPNWKYADVGTYNITLTVVDSARPRHIAYDYTTVTVVETEPSCVEITIIPSMGILGEVTNKGTLDVSYLNWTIIIEWGPSRILQREMGSGIIEFIEAKSSVSIQSSYTLFWFGFIRVTINVKPLNADEAQIQQNVLVLGSFVLPM